VGVFDAGVMHRYSELMYTIKICPSPRTCSDTVLSITLVHTLIVATWEAKKATRRSGFCLPNGIYRGTIQYTIVASIPLTHHSASFDSIMVLG
jgi:hypothetical protein